MSALLLLIAPELAHAEAAEDAPHASDTPDAPDAPSAAPAAPVVGAKDGGDSDPAPATPAPNQGDASVAAPTEPAANAATASDSSAAAPAPNDAGAAAVVSGETQAPDVQTAPLVAAPTEPPLVTPVPATQPAQTPTPSMQPEPVRPALVFSLAPELPARPPLQDRAATAHSNDSVETKPRLFGTLLDVGVPDGLMLGVALRPWSILRMDAAAGVNAVSLGVRAGMTLRLPTRISPVLSVAGGHFFEGNANGVTRSVAGADYSPLAQSVGYQFANLHTGVEFGLQKSTFYVHGGMSYLHSKLHAANDALRATQSADPSVSIDVKRDPTLTAWVPSIKIGFLMYWV